MSAGQMVQVSEIVPLKKGLVPPFASNPTTHGPRCHWQPLMSKVINSVPYRPVRPEYTVPASNPVHLIPPFRTEKNTGRTGLVPANFGQYRPIPGVLAGTEKSFYFYFLFLSFVIFEFF